MKKIIAIMMSAIMLIGVIAITAFADDGYSFNDLEEFGQQGWTIEGKTENAPIADGVIDEGEYTLEVKDMDPYNDDADDRFFCIDPAALDVENFNLYFSYDDDYIYLGAEVTESETLDGEVICFRIYSNDFDTYDGIEIQYSFGGTPNTSEAEAFATEQNGDVVTYELIIRRTLLSDYIGADDVDAVKEFFLLICLSDDRDPENHPELWPEMWFGCKMPKGSEGIASAREAAEAEGKIWGRGPDHNRFPHVMILGDSPETEPQETTPAETTPIETTPAETTPADTTPVETEPVAEGGCGASVAAIAVVLVAALGTCTSFINKRR